MERHAAAAAAVVSAAAAVVAVIMAAENQRSYSATLPPDGASRKTRFASGGYSTARSA